MKTTVEKNLLGMLLSLAFSLGLPALIVSAWLPTTCRASSKTEDASSTAAFPKLEAQLIFKSGSSAVGQYISSMNGFETNSYWIEGPDGLIFIDTQFLLSAGAEALDLAEKSTGKKVKLAIVLHPNPDKFNGTALFKKRGIRVVTSEQVLKLIPSVHELRKKWFFERFKPDYPSEVSLPDSFGSKDVDLTAAGITVRAHVMEAGCSGAHVVVEYKKHLFTGDLVHNGYHAWLELGLVNQWLKRLKELKALNPNFVHPGRGLPGDEDLISNQEKYLTDALSIVRRRDLTKQLNDQTVEKITDEIIGKYPTFLFPLFVEKGIPAIWKAGAKL